jgi:hypothetical protein
MVYCRCFQSKGRLVTRSSIMDCTNHKKSTARETHEKKQNINLDPEIDKINKRLDGMAINIAALASDLTRIIDQSFKERESLSSVPTALVMLSHATDKIQKDIKHITYLCTPWYKK